MSFSVDGLVTAPQRRSPRLFIIFLPLTFTLAVLGKLALQLLLTLWVDLRLTLSWFGAKWFKLYVVGWLALTVLAIVNEGDFHQTFTFSFLPWEWQQGHDLLARLDLTRFGHGLHITKAMEWWDRGFGLAQVALADHHFTWSPFICGLAPLGPIFLSLLILMFPAAIRRRWQLAR